MPQVPDVPCAGGCGKLLWRGKGVLPPGQSMCRPCRTARFGKTRLAACAYCSQPFTSIRGGHGWTKCCSVSCAQKQRARQPQAYVRTSDRWGRTCEVCGATYNATYSAQRTCSRTCGATINAAILNRVAAAKQPRVRLCLQCQGILPEGHWITCSRACQLGRERARRRAARVATPRACKCGASVEWPRRTCDPCREVADREAKKRARRIRKMRKRGVVSEPYTLAEIAKRDRYRCGLCHQRVAMTKVVPHPRSPTIDHVLPLADGGHDVRANVQLAHFLCNSLKGSRGSQQLALIG